VRSAGATLKEKMSDILDGVMQGIWLLVTLDPELIEITLRSLRITVSAV
jgi:tungstate transport system permease protein